MRQSVSAFVVGVLFTACDGTAAGAAEARELGPVGPVASEVTTEGPCSGNTRFDVGVGQYDITGPAAELGMMGYAMIEQKTAGIQQRLRSRAFVFVSPCNQKRVVFVSADLGQIFQAVKQQVVERLRARYGDTYSDENVMLSATHTHSGPGGFSHYALYNLTILGFDEQNFEAIVNGIFQSIVRAHANVIEAKVQIASGELLGASANRSPEAYARNPAVERAQYVHDTDKTMTLLRLQAATGRELGTVSWFAIHATSVSNQNTLINGDNKGYASWAFEKSKGTNYGSANTFVAAFAQSNEGDVTPNIYGGQNGGGVDDFDDARISGEKHLAKARELYGAATELVTGGVDYRHVHVDLSRVTVQPPFADGVSRNTCVAALGRSMIAGAEDGPGFGREGWSCRDVSGFWNEFSCAATTTECQGEKPIVLETGSMKPYPWTPEVLPLQVFRIGDFALVGVPFELTTMAGRRLRATVEARLQPMGVKRVVLAGLSNAYAGYVTTREEYADQQYEGASTHFGPWTLAAIQQETDKLAVAMRDGTAVSPGPTPRDLRDEQITLQTGVLFDDKPLGKEFGSVQVDAAPSYSRGQLVKVVFWGGHPKNNLRIGGSFLRIQRRVSGVWTTVATDTDWETRYRWRRSSCVPTLACSDVTIEWNIPANAPTGTYRVVHEGHWKSGWDGQIRPYSGTSRSFTVP